MSELSQPPTLPNTGRTIFRNTLIITGGNILLKVFNFTFGVYVVRRLGDDRFGQYSTVLAWVGLFQIFAELGMSQYVMREIARDRSKAQTLFWNLVAVRFLLGLIGVAGITAGAQAAGYSSDLVQGVFFYTWTFLLAAFGVPLSTVLSANERLDYVTAITLVEQASFILLGAIVLYSGLGFIALIAVGLVAMLPGIAIAVRVIGQQRLLDLKTPRIDPRQWLPLVRAGLPFGIISLALTIAYSIDTVMLSWYVPAAEVGWYNVAYGLDRSLVYFLGGFSVAMVPSLSRVYATDAAQVERWYFRSVKYIALLSLPAAVGGALIAYPLVRFLYNPSTLPAALALQVLIWDLPLMMFCSFCGNMTTVIGAERDAARIYSINAIANIALNLYAIPRYGMVGAALVTVITDLVGALQFYFLLRRRLKLPDMTWVLLRIALASTIMGSVVWLARGLHFVLLIGLGVLVYAGLVLGARLLDASEQALILRVLRSRFIRAPAR